MNGSGGFRGNTAEKGETGNDRTKKPMTDTGARRLCAEILRRAVNDVQQNYYPEKAMSFLRSSWAGMMFELLEIDQRMACAELADK